MKRKLLSLLMLVAMCALASCGKNESAEADNSANVVEESVEEIAEEPSEEELEKIEEEKRKQEQEEIEKALEEGKSAWSLKKGSLIDYEKAKKCFEKAAELGSPEAQNCLATIYLYARGTDQNIDKAIELYETAGESGYAEAYIGLGSLYRSPRFPEIEVDVEKAKQYYQKALDLGNKEALFYFGIIYEKDGDMEEAKNCYQEMIDSGLAEGWTHMGGLYAVKEFEINSDKMIECYEKGAELGDADAYGRLAEVYRYGICGAPKDLEKAKEYYIKGFEAGNTYLYQDIILIDGDKATAENSIEWFEKAIAAGEDSAYMNYGIAYLDGKYGIPADRRKGLSILQEGYDKGVPSAIKEYGYDYAFVVQEDQIETGIKMLNEAADGGDTQAMRLLAELYEKGEVVEKDIDKAKELHLKAAKLGNSGSMNDYATYFVFEEFGEPDFDEAEKWFEKAIEFGNENAQKNLEALKKYIDIHKESDKEDVELKEVKEESASQIEKGGSFSYSVQDMDGIVWTITADSSKPAPGTNIVWNGAAPGCVNSIAALNKDGSINYSTAVDVNNKFTLSGVYAKSGVILWINANDWGFDAAVKWLPDGTYN